MARLRSNPWVVLVVLCTGFFMILLDTTIVNLAIPAIIDALHSPLDQVLWVFNAYILVYAVLLITAGRLGDLYGQRNMFILGMALFVLASAMCGLSQDADQLIAARVIQGIGGAVLTPQTMSIITSIFPPQRRGSAFGMWSAVASLATVAGPVLGGIIVTTLSWRWIFFVNVPIGVASLVAAFLIVPHLKFERRHQLDLTGVSLAIAGLLALVFGLIEGQRYGWGAIWGWVTIPEIMVLGMLILLAFGLWESFQPEPLVPLSLFHNRNYFLMNWVGCAVGFGMFAVFLPLMIYLQSALGMTALVAGLTLAPQSLAAMLMAPFTGRMADRLGGKYILIGGLLLFSGGIAWLVFVASAESTWLTFLPPMIISGVGQACVFPPMATEAMREINPRMAGAASGVFNTMRQMGGVLGSAVIGAVLQIQLVADIHAQALIAAQSLPIQFQQQFVDAITEGFKGSLDISSSRSAGLRLPAGIPTEIVDQIRLLFPDVFVQGFITAMRTTILVPIVVLLLAIIACAAVERKAGRAEEMQPSESQSAEGA